jgi:hypothetical protein
MRWNLLKEFLESPACAVSATGRISHDVSDNCGLQASPATLCGCCFMSSRDTVRLGSVTGIDVTLPPPPTQSLHSPEGVRICRLLVAGCCCWCALLCPRLALSLSLSHTHPHTHQTIDSLVARPVATYLTHHQPWASRKFRSTRSYRAPQTSPPYISMPRPQIGDLQLHITFSS